ncbi:hypothetical protein TSAR_001207, partial [Trichomalopsis sarcophagae]
MHQGINNIGLHFMLSLRLGFLTLPVSAGARGGSPVLTEIASLVEISPMRPTRNPGSLTVMPVAGDSTRRLRIAPASGHCDRGFRPPIIALQRAFESRLFSRFSGNQGIETTTTRFREFPPVDRHLGRVASVRRTPPPFWTTEVLISRRSTKESRFEAQKDTRTIE